ncbi:MAG: right-handed parallel beta-helix repeat-containing protein, partial [Thermoplasmata archaeon]|nr:right-handed parallel beta-helix repeat-containing protein [Thermoplasmata archaeon]
EDNTASNNTNEGIHIRLSNDNNLSGNNVSHSETGILLWHADRSSIVANTVSHNVYGVFAESSMYGTFVGNLMTENGFYLEGQAWQWNNHFIDTSNTVNGRPVRYWKNVTGGTVPLDAGQVILANCTGVTVEDQNISEATVGIAIGYSSGNTISHNALSSNSVSGIMLDSSEHITLSQNTAYDNTYGISIFYGIPYLGRNNITSNTISLNWRGILFSHSSENFADNNTISENGRGFDLFWSDGNVLSNNSIRFNSEHGVSVIASNGNRAVRNLIYSSGLGVSVRFSTGNTIYHNDFVDNPQSAYDDSVENQWDDGYPSGGNYWSDYTGVDLSSGPNQDQPGSDGIGDTPYDKIGVNEDRYPLMSPMTTIIPRPPESLRAYLSGDALENVTIQWDLSPDDGNGLGSVVGYEVYRGSAYSPDGSGYGLVASLTNGTSSTVDNYSGEGDPNTYFYRVCAVDTSNNSACADDQAAKFTRPLSPGPNLISIPLIQSDESVETVLQTVEYDKAWFYDSSSREWNWFMKHKGYRRGLWNVNQTMGIWINVTQNSNLTVAGIVPAQTVIRLTAGWNLVSFPSFNTTYTVADLKAETGATRVEGYDPAPPYHLRVLGDGEMLQAGYGYWVEAQADADWIVEVA